MAVRKMNPSEFKLRESRGELLPEPILIPNKQRFVLLPIQHSDVGRLFLSPGLL